MNFFRDLPIRRKLALISLFTSGVALLMAAAGFVTYEQVTFRREMARDLSTTARMLGFNSAAALSFGDSSAADRNLQGLVAQPHIISAAIYSLSGEIFATYQREPQALASWPRPPATDRANFRPGALDIFRRIEYNGEDIGLIYLQSDLGEITARWQRYTLIVAAVMLAAGLLAWLLSLRLQRVISVPISHLAAIAQTVAAGQGYSVRAAKEGNDELGQLIDGFNHMLAQIEARDAALQKANDALESRVQERTRQLEAEALERNRVTDALRVSEGFLHSLLEHLPVNIYRRDREGRIVFANRHYCERRGLPLAQLLGKTDFDLSPLPLARKYWQDSVTAMETRQPIDRVEMQPKPNGEETWIHIVKVPVIDASGQVIGTQGMYWDITERKRAEVEVEKLNRQLVETSRQAGMAEVATSVLHNVGNVLNSVNVSANVISDVLRKSRVSNVARVAALLQEHSADLGKFLLEDPRGKQVVGYLGQLAGQLGTEQQGLVAELEELKKNMEHIKVVVSMQQSYAKVSGVIETLPVSHLVEDALRMNADALARHGIALVRDFEETPPLSADKHKVLQILVNLIRNSKFACDESGRPDKVITLQVRRQPSSVSIAIIDNGVGIPPENLTRIFNHGFTTRKEGHGFGLHSGALAAKEMQGSLVATSEGPGQGATFTLTLPLALPGQEANAA